jgi:hypothetical protein
MLSQDVTKQQIVDSLDRLPGEFLNEVATFLDYLQYKIEQKEQRQTPYRPVALGGLWEGVHISDDDIRQVREEMWNSLGEREL